MTGKMYIGVDIGGTHMRSALVENGGRIVSRRRALTMISQGAEPTAQRLTKECNALMEEASRVGGRVAAVGLGVAGKIDRLRGRVVFSPNLPAMNGYPLALRLRDHLQVPVSMENDANAFGVGESWLGAGRGIDNWIGVTLGTGIGGCLVLGGRLWQGDDLGFAGEIGHVIVRPDGAACVCGQNGCLEAYASASALQNAVDAAVSQGRLADGPLFDLWKEGGLSADAIFRCADEGDSAAQRLFDRMGWALGLALANFFRVLGIRHAIIGGGVSAAWERFITPLNRSIARYSSMLDTDSVEIRRSALGDDAALLGSARLAMQAAFGE